MTDLCETVFTLYSASGVAVEVDEKVITFLFLFLGVAAALQSQIATIFNIEILPEHFMTINQDTLRSKVTIFVEVPGGPDEDVCDVFHIGWEQVHS